MNRAVEGVAMRVACYNEITGDLESDPMPEIDLELRKIALTPFVGKMTSLNLDFTAQCKSCFYDPDPASALKVVLNSWADGKKGRKKKELEVVEGEDSLSKLEFLVGSSFRFVDDFQVPGRLGCNLVNVEYTKGFSIDITPANLADNGNFFSWRCRQLSFL